MATIGNRDGWKVAYVSVDSEFKYYTSYKKLVLLSCSLIGEFLSGSYCYVFFCLEGSQGVHLLRFSILSSSLLLVRQIWKNTSSSSLGGKSENGMRCPCTLWFRIRGLNAMPVASTTRIALVSYSRPERQAGSRRQREAHVRLVVQCLWFAVAEGMMRATRQHVGLNLWIVLWMSCYDQHNKYGTPIALLLFAKKNEEWGMNIPLSSCIECKQKD